MVGRAPSLSGDVVTRPAVAGDARGIARCQGDCWREAYTHLAEPGFFDDRPDGTGAARWSEVLATPGVDVLVAVRGGSDEVVGFAGSGPPTPAGEPDGSAPPTPRQLHAIYLRAGAHGTGVADRLLVQSLGDGPAHLWVFADNPRARASTPAAASAPTAPRRSTAGPGSARSAWSAEAGP